MNADPEAQFYNFDAASPDGLVGAWPPCLSLPEGGSCPIAMVMVGSGRLVCHGAPAVARRVLPYLHIIIVDRMDQHF